MTVALSGEEIAAKLVKKFPGSVVGIDKNSIIIKPENLFDVASYLKTEPGLEFDYLIGITAVDYYDYFELVYQLASIKHNHSLTIKARCHGREKPQVPSVIKVWRGADFQEREIYDLMGIAFEGHPNLKRIVLWEGFQGHPQRKDYL